MKKLNIFQKAIADIFGITSVQKLPLVLNNNVRTFGFNQGVTIYPYGKDDTYIGEGYNKNSWVFSIVSKCAKKFGQVPWYHYKVKTTERKTWAEYQQLTKHSAYLT
jgi:tRNA-dihydrouridine synthase